MSFKKNVRSGGGGGGGGGGRPRRTPVQLFDFLRSGFEAAKQPAAPSKASTSNTSASSDVSPAVSGSTSAKKAVASTSTSAKKAVASTSTSAKKAVVVEERPKNPWDIQPNDNVNVNPDSLLARNDEFPAVGTIRNKKAKSRAAAALLVAPLVAKAAKTASAAGAKAAPPLLSLKISAPLAAGAKSATATAPLLAPLLAPSPLATPPAAAAAAKAPAPATSPAPLTAPPVAGGKAKAKALAKAPTPRSASPPAEGAKAPPTVSAPLLALPVAEAQAEVPSLAPLSLLASPPPAAGAKATEPLLAQPPLSAPPVAEAQAQVPLAPPAVLVTPKLSAPPVAEEAQALVPSLAPPSVLAPPKISAPPVEEAQAPLSAPPPLLAPPVAEAQVPFSAPPAVVVTVAPPMLAQSAPPPPPPPASPLAVAEYDDPNILSSIECVNKQDEVAKWLESVEPPIMDQLEPPIMDQLEPELELESPETMANMEAELNEASICSPVDYEPMQVTESPEMPSIASGSQMIQAPSEASLSVSYAAADVVAMETEPINTNWRRIDWNNPENIDQIFSKPDSWQSFRRRNNAASIAETPTEHRSSLSRQWRRHERRNQRDQMWMAAGAQDQGPSTRRNDMNWQSSGQSYSAFNQQQQAMTSMSVSQTQSQSQLSEIAARSTLNLNANEFYPNQRYSMFQNRRNCISGRRRRQRFYRTLKPNTLFELVPLSPQELMPQPMASNWEPQPTYDIPQDNSYMLQHNNYMQNNNNNNYNSNMTETQSVFRLPSLRSGIGTAGKEVLSTTCVPLDTSVLTEYAVDATLSGSRPLLNMDTQELPPPEMSTFFEPEIAIETNNINDFDILNAEKEMSPPDACDPPLPRHMIFVTAESYPRSYITVDLNFMPPSIKQLHRLICAKYSDYAFVYALSAQLSQTCVPMECYVYLKMALLASLASIEPDELRPPISLCVICSDSCVTHKLLDSVGQLAPRFIGPHEGGQQLGHTALSTRHTWQVANPMLMAQQGVYYVGDWNRLTRDQCEEIEKCIENGNVPLPEFQSVQLLETAIWTYWQPEDAANQTTAFAKLCPIFGMPVYMEGQVNDVLWDHVLRLRTEDGQDTTQDAFNIPMEDMRTMLGLLHQRRVVFTDKAEQLLQKYYVVSRIEQPTAFSSKTYIVLKEFAESIAKLGMRMEVIEADVTVAIFHCEHFVRNIFGAGDYPPPAVASFNVISRVDPYMNEFARWLFEYLDRYEDEVNSAGDKPAKRQRFDSS